MSEKLFNRLQFQDTSKKFSFYRQRTSPFNTSQTTFPSCRHFVRRHEIVVFPMSIPIAHFSY
jgi:hypothetical protein